MIRGNQEGAKYQVTLEEDDADPTIFIITPMTTWEHNKHQASLSKGMKMGKGGKITIKEDQQHVLRMNAVLDHLKGVRNYSWAETGKVVKSTDKPEELKKIVEELQPGYFLDLFEAIFDTSDLPLVKESD